jgi:hypothetical protein
VAGFLLSAAILRRTVHNFLLPPGVAIHDGHAIATASRSASRSPSLAAPPSLRRGELDDDNGAVEVSRRPSLIRRTPAFGFRERPAQANGVSTELPSASCSVGSALHAVADVWRRDSTFGSDLIKLRSVKFVHRRSKCWSLSLLRNFRPPYERPFLCSGLAPAARHRPPSDQVGKIALQNTGRRFS